jgi:uncharacterized protein
MGRLRADRLAGPAAPLSVEGGPVLAARCYRATSPLARLVGLLATPDLSGDESLWLEPCSSVHTLGLRARIGAAFLDAEGRVLRVIDPLPGGRIAACRGARAVVECRAGVLAGVAPGSRLRRDRAPAADDLPAPSERRPPRGGRDERPGGL